MENLKNSISVQDQRIFLKFCFLLNYSSGVSHKLLVKSVGRNALSKRTVAKWLQSYREGRVEAEDLPREGRPISTTRLEAEDKIKEALRESRNWSVEGLSQHLGIPHTTVQRVLTEDLGLVSKLATWVPHALSDTQKEFRLEVARANLSQYRRSPDMLRSLICIDESWVQFYTAPQRHQTRSWVRPCEDPGSIPRAELHERKVLLTVGMDITGVAFWTTYEENVTMTAERYHAFLERQIPQWAASRHVTTPIILHDNAKPHKSRLVQEFLQEKGWVELIHPPYSPDMHPCDYNCFGNLKRELPRLRFTNKHDLDKALQGIIHRLNEKSTFSGVRNLPEVWQSVIDKLGDY